uniref:Uncharacterized protein n=1 Tax=Ditylenchus dipsaci TaxID=166011 RepID=A0A915CX46_9BILA
MGDTEKEELMTKWKSVCQMCTSGSEAKFVTRSDLLKIGFGDAYQRISTEFDTNGISKEIAKNLPFGVKSRNTDMETEGRVTEHTDCEAKDHKRIKIGRAPVQEVVSRWISARPWTETARHDTVYSEASPEPVSHGGSEAERSQEPAVK